MRKQVSSIVAMTALVIAAAVIPTYAQSAPILAASIPFNFVVKDKALPAGEYTIQPVQFAASQALKIQSRDGHITVMVPARFDRNITKQGEPKLLFSRFGDKYFLSQVQGFEEKATYSLLKSRTEDELAKSGSAPKPHTLSITGRHQ